MWRSSQRTPCSRSTIRSRSRWFRSGRCCLPRSSCVKRDQRRRSRKRWTAGLPGRSPMRDHDMQTSDSAHPSTDISLDDSLSPRIAVLVPCHNEEAAVATVVADFRKALPSAEIYVYDNNSKDRTAAVAREAGAQVRSERRQGKGHVVRRMFADVDADIYVLVDGDATYDAPSAPRMIAKLLGERLDMVVGLRVDQSQAAYRRGHRTGNRLLTQFLSSTFGHDFKDILSGYRVFSRR